MEWKGLSKSVNAEEIEGYHASGATMMTNLPTRTGRDAAR
jgi:hypothetical protein